jgi:hypothetical protein
VSVQTATLSQDKILLKAFVRPSMEGKPARPLWISFHENMPTQAFCRCPAGKSGLCCHVSATLYALEEHNRTYNLTLELPCTSQLQTWHKNKPWKGQVTSINSMKVEAATKKVKNPQRRDSSVIAKKVQHILSDSSNYSNSHREQWLLSCISSTSTRKSAICNVLSHRYKQNSNSEICSDYSLDGEQFDQVTSTTSEVEACPEVSIDQKDHIEKVTRSQRTNPLWHQHRQYRIASFTARKELHSTDAGRPALIDKIMNQQPIRNGENISPAMLYVIKN